MTGPRHVALYRAVVGLYPRRFREEYGEDMVMVFEEMHADGRAASVWARTLRDAASSILVQRLETAMLKKAFLPISFAVLAGVVLVAVSARGVNNLLTFALTALVTGGAAVAALVYWYANRAYVEPSDQLHRYWLHFLAVGVASIALVNVGTGLDVEAPWLLLFATIIVGIMLVVIGAILGVWHGLHRFRTVRAA